MSWLPKFYFYITQLYVLLFEKKKSLKQSKLTPVLWPEKTVHLQLPVTASRDTFMLTKEF